MFLEEVADIFFSFPERTMCEKDDSVLWLTSASLQSNNRIINPVKDDTLSIKKAVKVFPGDIVVKRIQPQFVNYICEDNDYYLGQNLALIRPHKSVCGKYLAFVLENKIENLYRDMTGTTIPSIRKNGFDFFAIGELPPLDKQNAIGQLWWLMKEKNKYQEELLEKEYVLLKTQLNKLLDKRG